MMFCNVRVIGVGLKVEGMKGLLLGRNKMIKVELVNELIGSINGVINPVALTWLKWVAFEYLRFTCAALVLILIYAPTQGWSIMDTFLMFVLIIWWSICAPYELAKELIRRCKNKNK
jgi:hypothetical protein